MKYEIVRPWHGKKAGEVIETDKLHPALKSHVRPLQAAVTELVPATPTASAPRRGRQAKPEAEAE